jgi:acetyl-CoA C-acetyltransferase
MSERTEVAIVAVAESDLGKTPGKNAAQLQAQAARRALVEAGLTLADIDAVFAHTDGVYPSLLMTEYLGIKTRYTDSSSAGGLSNLMHVVHAIAAIQAGLCEVALITYGSTQASDASRRLGGIPEDPRSPRSQFVTPYGQMTPLGYYAMAARRHMHQYGTTNEQMAEVAVAARKWAQLNPKAYRREPLSVEEVLSSPMIAEPLHVRDCCLVTDGGGAVILTSAERARSLRQTPVRVIGAAESQSHHFTPLGIKDWLDTGVSATARRAMQMAGVTHDDLDVVQIYDHFTSGVIQALEDLGFCGRGEGGPFVTGGRIAPGGALALNTSGGGLSYGHPGMFGIFLIIEAVRQLRGECGERQVRDAKLALCQGASLVFSAQTTLILGKD